MNLRKYTLYLDAISTVEGYNDGTYPHKKPFNPKHKTWKLIRWSQRANLTEIINSTAVENTP